MKKNYVPGTPVINYLRMHSLYFRKEEDAKSLIPLDIVMNWGSLNRLLVQAVRRAQWDSLTFKRKRVVSVHRTRGGINMFNKKCLCTAHHQNYLNNMCLFHVPGVRCTLMRSLLMLTLYLKKNAMPLRLWRSKSKFCSSFPVEEVLLEPE